MRRVYLVYLGKLCSQLHNCSRQANSNRTMARPFHCRAFDKLAFEEPYALDAEYLQTLTLFKTKTSHFITQFCETKDIFDDPSSPFLFFIQN